MRGLLVLLVLLLTALEAVVALVNTQYLPIVLIHGISNTPRCWTKFKQTVARERPGQRLIALASPFDGAGSLAALPVQVAWFRTALVRISRKQLGGSKLDLVCHSQGAVICQAMILEGINGGSIVNRLVSLAGPQMGVYGELWFQFLPSGLQVRTLQAMSQLAYQPWAQQALSVANLWHDPHNAQLFAERNTFLPKYLLHAHAANSSAMKQNYLLLDRAAYLVGSFGNDSRTHDDGIDPWQSGVFGYYEGNKMVDVWHSPVYLQDVFGLQTLHKRGRLSIEPHPGVLHDDWLYDADVIRRLVTPHLSPPTSHVAQQ